MLAPLVWFNVYFTKRSAIIRNAFVLKSTFNDLESYVPDEMRINFFFIYFNFLINSSNLIIYPRNFSPKNIHMSSFTIWAYFFLAMDAHAAVRFFRANVASFHYLTARWIW